MYFKATPRPHSSFVWHNGKVKKKKVWLQESGTSLGTIFRCLKVPHSSVQTIVCRYRHNGNVQKSYHSGRITSSVSYRWTCFRPQCANQPQNSKYLVKMLRKDGKTVSLSTVKSVPYQHSLKCPSTKKDITITAKEARLLFANAHKFMFSRRSCLENFSVVWWN